MSSVGGPGGAGVQITRSSIANNGTGAESTAATAFILFSNTLISGNGTGLSSVTGGNLLTYKNNSFDGNFTAGAFTGTLNPE